MNNEPTTTQLILYIARRNHLSIHTVVSTYRRESLRGMFESDLKKISRKQILTLKNLQRGDYVYVITSANKDDKLLSTLTVDYLEVESIAKDYKGIYSVTVIKNVFNKLTFNPKDIYFKKSDAYKHLMTYYSKSLREATKNYAEAIIDEADEPHLVKLYTKL